MPNRHSRALTASRAAHPQSWQRAHQLIPSTTPTTGTTNLLLQLQRLCPPLRIRACSIHPLHGRLQQLLHQQQHPLSPASAPTRPLTARSGRAGYGAHGRLCRTAGAAEAGGYSLWCSPVPAPAPRTPGWGPASERRAAWGRPEARGPGQGPTVAWAQPGCPGFFPPSHHPKSSDWRAL